MSLDTLLIHTCTIENPATGASNAYNNKVKAYATAVTGVRCRLIESRERLEKDEVTEATVETTYLLMVHGDVSLQEKAKVSLVTLEDGSTLSDVFEVESVLHRRGRNSHHKSAILKRIS